MKKSKIQKDDLLRDGTVHYGIAIDGAIWENGKPLTTAKPSEPVKPTALDVVARPTPTNAAPKVTDPPQRRAPSGVTGLQRAILANIAAQGGAAPELVKRNDSVTGLQRSINAAIAAQKK
jgi:hypothetical protein